MFVITILSTYHCVENLSVFSLQTCSADLLWMGWSLYLPGYPWLLVLICSIPPSLVAFHYFHSSQTLGCLRSRPTQIWAQVVGEVVPGSTGRGVGIWNKLEKKAACTEMATAVTHWGAVPPGTSWRLCRPRLRVLHQTGEEPRYFSTSAQHCLRLLCFSSWHTGLSSVGLTCSCIQR